MQISENKKAVLLLAFFYFEKNEIWIPYQIKNLIKIENKYINICLRKV